MSIWESVINKQGIKDGAPTKKQKGFIFKIELAAEVKRALNLFDYRLH